MCSSWPDLPLDIGHLILDRLSEVVEYVRFGAVCKHWSVIPKQYQQQGLNGRKALPMLLVPSPTAPAEPDQPKLYALSCLGKYYQNLNHRLPFTRFRYCGSSNGWLATQNPDFTFTLLYPFAGGELLTIHLPVLDDPSDERKHDAVTHKLIVSSASTPDNFTVVAIYGFLRKLATIKSGEESWFRFKKSAGTFCGDVIFNRENKVYVLCDSSKIMRLNVNVRPPRLKIIYPGDGPGVYKSYIVESSTTSELFVLGRRENIEPVNVDFMGEYDNIDFENENDEYQDDEEDQSDRDEEEDEHLHERQWSTNKFDVCKFKLDKRTGDVVEKIETKNLNGDAFFVGDSASMSFPATCFSGCKPNSIYFTDDYIYHPEYESFGPEDVRCYNVEDVNMEKIYSVIPYHKHYMSQSIWITPPYPYHTLL